MVSGAVACHEESARKRSVSKAYPGERGQEKVGAPMTIIDCGVKDGTHGVSDGFPVQADGGYLPENSSIT